MVFHDSPLKISILEFLRYVKRTFEEISGKINNNNKSVILAIAQLIFLLSVINLGSLLKPPFAEQKKENLRPQSEQSG